MTNSKPVPLDDINKMLVYLMDIAVKNGANSVSMPDEYVSVAHFVSFPEQYGVSTTVRIELHGDRYRAFGTVSDEQIEVVLEECLADLRSRSNLG